MKTLAATIALIASTTSAMAHEMAVPHVHGSDAVFFGAVLVLAVGVIGWMRAR
ncbi:MAG: hypothetical protein AAGK71_14755 [Pseudomonadota bacterium]